MTTASATVEVSDKPEPIDCRTYDVDRFMAQVDAARHHWSSYPVPSGWTLEPALARPISAEQFQPIHDKLVEMRDGSGADREYPARQAFLTVSILQGGFWSPDCSRAVAYATLRVGMVDHGYRPRTRNFDAILLFAEPSNALCLYGDTVERLTALLHAAYLEP